MIQLIYGVHAVDEKLRTGFDKANATLLVQKGKTNVRRDQLISLAKSMGLKVVQLDRQELDAKLQGEVNHQGIVLELMDAPAWPALETVISEAENPLLLILDGVTDPRNLGACLRSAAAFGCAAVIAPKDASAPLNGAAYKTASGAADRIPYYQVTNLSRTLKTLQAEGVWVVGMALEGQQMLKSIDLTGPIALVMGSEGEGIRRLVREHCDFLARLPMATSDQNLNVSVATGVSLYEAFSQRSGSPVS